MQQKKPTSTRKTNSASRSSQAWVKGLLASVIGMTLTASAGSAFGFYQEYDRPTERSKWRADWYDEGTGQNVKKKEKNGGRLSAEFRRQMLISADKERAK